MGRTPPSSGPRVSMVPVPLGSTHWARVAVSRALRAVVPGHIQGSPSRPWRSAQGRFWAGLVFLYGPPCWLQAADQCRGRRLPCVLLDHATPRSPFPFPCISGTLRLSHGLAEKPRRVGRGWSPLLVTTLQAGGNGGLHIHPERSRCPEVESWLGCTRAVWALISLRVE